MGVLIFAAKAKLNKAESKNTTTILWEEEEDEAAATDIPLNAFLVLAVFCCWELKKKGGESCEVEEE